MDIPKVTVLRYQQHVVRIAVSADRGILRLASFQDPVYMGGIDLLKLSLVLQQGHQFLTSYLSGAAKDKAE